MAKERISSNVDKKLRIEADAKAEELGISRAKFIEIALKSELGRFNVHRENKRLTEARATAEAAAEEARKQRDYFKVKAEEAESNYRTCSEKFRLLLMRNWWDRLWNALPWITETSRPTDETIE